MRRKNKMCNLNIIIKHKVGVFTNKSIPAFLMGVTKNSYTNNDDGDGIFLNSHNILIKGKRKVNLYKYENQIRESDIIITHQRIATSGMKVKYTQPFSNKDFILAHNGVISEVIKGDESDTYSLFKNFVKLFNKSKGERNKRIVDAITESINSISYGSYSIVIYDKKTKALYYFKNNNTFIHFYRSKNVLFITTNWNNETFLKILHTEDFKDLKIEDNIIYKISVKKNITIRKAGKLKETKNVYYYDYSKDDKKDKDNDNFKLDDIDYKDNYESNPAFKEVMFSDGVCVECDKRAHKMFVATFEHICDECLSYIEDFEGNITIITEGDVRYKKDRKYSNYNAKWK